MTDTGIVKKMVATSEFIRGDCRIGSYPVTVKDNRYKRQEGQVEKILCVNATRYYTNPRTTDISLHSTASTGTIGLRGIKNR